MSTRKKILEITAKEYNMNEKYNINIRDIFKHVKIFAAISNHKGLSLLQEEGRILEVQKGEVIVQEGKKENTAYIIMDGEIKILRKSLSGDDFVVSILKSEKEENFYPFIGEQSFISTGVRTATVQALTTVLMFELHHTSFLKVIEVYPEIGLNVYRELCMILQKRLVKSHNDVVALFESHLDFIAEDLMQSTSDLE